MSAADDPQKAVLVPFEDEDQLESASKEDILVEEMAVQESEDVQEKKTVEVTDNTPFFPSNARWLSPGRLSSRKDNCIVQIHRINAVATLVIMTM